MLNRDDILKGSYKTAEINVPGFTDTVLIRELSVAHVRAYGAEVAKAEEIKEKKGDATGYFDTYVAIASLAIINKDGEREFTDKDRPKLSEVLTFEQAVFIGTEILKLSGMTPEAAKKLEEDTLKNSESGQSSDSDSA